MTGKEIQQKLDRYGITKADISRTYGIDHGRLSHITRGGNVSQFARAFFTLLFEKLEKYGKQNK